MKRKFFYSVVVVVMLFALALMGGGCGGSGDLESVSNPDDPKEETKITEDNIAEIIDEELEKMRAELEADGAFEKIEANGGLEIVQSAAEAANYKASFDNGMVLVFVSPDAGKLTEAFTTLGCPVNLLVSGNEDEEDGNEKSSLASKLAALDLFAVAKRVQTLPRTSTVWTADNNASVDVVSDDELVHFFSFHADDNAIPESYGEVSIEANPTSKDESQANDSTSDTVAEVDEEALEQAFFRAIVRLYVERWKNMFLWAADDIDGILAESEASAALLVQAADTSTELAQLTQAAHTTVDFSYTKSFSPFSGKNSGNYNTTLSRRAQALYSVYSCHSFETGSDFYLVKSQFTTTPGYSESLVNDQSSEYWDDGDRGCYTDYHRGYTSHVYNKAYVSGADNDSNVQIVKVTPSDTVPKNTNISRSMGWSQGGEVSFELSGSFNGETGTVGGKIGGKRSWSISHNEGVSYTTTDFEIRNETYGNKPSFNADFSGISANDSNGWQADDQEYQSLTVPSAAKNAFTFTTEWVWEVKKPFWQAHPTFSMRGNPSIVEAFHHGWGTFHRSIFYHDQKADSQHNTATVDSDKEFAHYRPAHLWVSQIRHDLPKVGTTGGLTPSFELLCSGNWKVTSDSDWCKIADICKEGVDTGSTRQAIFFSVDPMSDSDPNVRRAKIRVAEIRDDNTEGDVAIVSVYQNKQGF